MGMVCEETSAGLLPLRIVSARCSIRALPINLSTARNLTGATDAGSDNTSTRAKAVRFHGHD
jgi:hypothetical protein